MQRQRSLVAYDIRDPKRLRLVHRTLKGFGISFQYSVFLCDLTAAERLELLRQLMEVIDASCDCVAVVLLGTAYDESGFTFLGPRPPFPRPGPTIL